MYPVPSRGNVGVLLPQERWRIYYTYMQTFYSGYGDSGREHMGGRGDLVGSRRICSGRLCVRVPSRLP